MGMSITCDMCNEPCRNDCDFYIVRSFGVTLGDSIPVYAKSCYEHILCRKCWDMSFSFMTNEEVVE